MVASRVKRSMLLDRSPERNFRKSVPSETPQRLRYITSHAALLADAVLPRYERVISSFAAQQLERVDYDLEASCV